MSHSATDLTSTDVLESPTTIYLAGPMRGYPNFNFEAFAEAAFNLRLAGHTVWSPAEHDLANGFDPSTDECGPLREYMKIDLPVVLECGAVVLLPGWEASAGATLEYQVATACDIPTFGYPDLRRIRKVSEAPEPVNGTGTDSHATGDKKIVTNAVTGGMKETRPARFDLLPWDILWMDAEHYGVGAKKYEDRNWEKGYDFALSIAALQRHMAKFIQGESFDEENGSHHLAAVRFHAAALMRFEQEIAAGRMPAELDTRPRVGFGQSEPEDVIQIALFTPSWWEEAA